MYFEPEVLSKVPKNRVPGLCCGYTDLPSQLEASSLTVAEDHVRHNAGRRGLTSTGGIQFKTSPEEVGITLGPVVGLVTHRTARILIETNVATHVNMHLIGRDYFARKQHRVPAKKVTCNGSEPTVVEFTDLKPNYRYTICTDVKMFDLVDAHFRTLPCPETQARSLLDGPVKIALVSGNDVTYVTRHPLGDESSSSFTKRYPAQSTDVSLWRDLYERIEDEKIHMVIHLGNNIQVGGTRETLFHEMMKSAVGSEDAYEIVKEEYRKVWNESWCKHVLASCSNIMILSESDIGCLVSRPDSYNDADLDEEQIAEQRIAEAAMKAYRNYQQVLWTHESDAHVYSKVVRMNNYLSLMLVDFVSYATNIDAKMQPLSVISDLQRPMEQTDPRSSTSEPNEMEDGEIPDQVMAPIGPEHGLLVVSSCSLTDAVSPAQHDALFSTTSSFITSLFSWKTARADGEREVMLVSAACRANGFKHGEATISLKGYNTTLKEWIVGPMVARQGVALNAGSFWNMFNSKSSFNRGPLKFTHDTQKSTLGYSVLTFGGKLDAPQVDQDEHARRGRIQCVPTFWIEDFVAQAHKRSIVHEFGQFQNKLYLQRDSYCSTEHTRIPRALPPFRSRVVWK